MPRPWLWLSRTSFCALLAVTGCSEGDGRDLFRPGPPLPECPDADYSTCDVRAEDCQARLLELAACLRDTKAPSGLDVDVLTRDQYAERLRKGAKAKPLPKVQHVNRALSVFGLAPLEGVPQDEQIEEQADFVAGQYLWEEKRVIVVDHGRPASSAGVNAVLVHELVHALQDAEHDLATWPGDGEAQTFDASLAPSTVVEGEASFYESRVAAPLLGLNHAQVDFEAAFTDYMARALVRTFDSKLLLTQSFRTVPYGIGGLQAFHAWEDGGPRGTDPLWNDPPLTMQRVLADMFGGNTPQARAVNLLAPEPPEGLTLHGDDALGAWGLCLALTKRSGNALRVTDFIDQALTWRGDRLSVFADDDANTYALWQLQLEDARAAREWDEWFEEAPVEHGVSGSRVFVSYGVDGARASKALTALGREWLDSSGD